MTKIEFEALIKDKIIILDGATGTQLQEKGMPKGVSPEQWIINHPQIIIDIQDKYINAGSNIIYSPTFSANRIKLKEFGLQDNVIEINKQLARLSKKTAKEKAFVAGNLSPTGKFISPIGNIPFEDIVDTYKEQVKGLLLGGVDLFVIETMIDIQEARAALLAVKEMSSLPVLVSMSFEADGYTLTGTNPRAALVTLQSLGADAVGCNCSTGPEAMLQIIKQLKVYAKVALFAKPNAGLPTLIDGKTVFNMDYNEFGTYAKEFALAGANLLGGCCGTNEKYISNIAYELKNIKPIHNKNNNVSVLSSARKAVFIEKDAPLMVVGERINPTGKKALQKDLIEGRNNEIVELGIQQVKDGAHILDVNVGMPGINEKETLKRVVETLSYKVEAPLCIDSSSPEAIEAALRIYPGRALINSISAEENKINKLLAIAAKYGSMFILLPLDDNGVPEEAGERINLIKKVFLKAQELGFEKEDIIVDGLVMTVSSNQGSALETLKVIDWVANDFNCNTIIGLSNVSFGLPRRDLINASFLSMAAVRGLSMAIANPSDVLFMNTKKASDILLLRDKESRQYIANFSDPLKNEQVEGNTDNLLLVTDKIYNSILNGDKDNIIQHIKLALDNNIEAQVIVDKYLIPAITEVGELYEEGRYFLPQLISSAATMKNAFTELEPILHKEKKEIKNKVKVVLATVKGDVHDIGKNIVGLMLKNHGFEVHDLGKNIDSKQIIEKTKAIGGDIIALSALMTTTMVEMKAIITLAKKENLACKIIIGGAPVTKNYAEEIGADGYAEDAYSAVKLAQSFLK